MAGKKRESPAGFCSKCAQKPQKDAEPESDRIRFTFENNCWAAVVTSDSGSCNDRVAWTPQVEKKQ